MCKTVGFGVLFINQNAYPSIPEPKMTEPEAHRVAAPAPPKYVAI
jgi:hypothetical protein